MPDDWFSPDLGDLASSQTHWTPQQPPAPDYRSQAFQAAGSDPYRYAVQSVQDPNNPDRRIAEQFGMQGSIMGAQGATLEELLNLAKAQRSLGAGLSPESAMELYGWGNWPGVNKMVSEFSDQPAGWNPVAEQSLKGRVFKPGMQALDPLPNFLSHPELFARYPHLEQTPLLYYRTQTPLGYHDYPLGAHGSGVASSLDAVRQSTRASYPFTRDTPLGMFAKRYEPKWETPEQRKADKRRAAGKPQEISSLIHEAQHSIARREGFPMGGGGAQAGGYWKNAGEAQARAAQLRANLGPEELRREGGIVGAIGREVPFSEQGFNPLTVRPQPHDAPGWPGPAFDLETPAGQQQMMIDYAQRNLGRDLRERQMPGDLLDRLRQALGQ